MLQSIESAKIGIIGLGYVGLPLALAFGRRYSTWGFDINQARLAELERGEDSTREATAEEMAAASQLVYTSDIQQLAQCNVYIITVPTPIDENNRPDLQPIIKSSQALAPLLSEGDTVIYESTVYPGTSEEVCVPLLEQGSGLKFNKDFFLGYSPERINPGDKLRRLTNILKITSGSTEPAADFVDALYASIIEAGTYKAESIRVAEAAKVIENTQRDVNIALINELAIIFNKLDIDTEAVLKAAGTKWNFLPFRPGLVGGHCISVDPYYLSHKAQSVGYHPDVMMSARRLNDGIAEYLSSRMIKAMLKRNINVSQAKVLVLGLAFKENCPDLRNTKVVNVINDLRQYVAQVDVYDPWVSAGEVEHEYGFTPLAELPEQADYQGIFLSVAHDQFIELGANAIRRLGAEQHVLFDIKSALPREASDLRF